MQIAFPCCATISNSFATRSRHSMEREIHKAAEREMQCIRTVVFRIRAHIERSRVSLVDGRRVRDTYCTG